MPCASSTKTQSCSRSRAPIRPVSRISTRAVASKVLPQICRRLPGVFADTFGALVDLRCRERAHSGGVIKNLGHNLARRAVLLQHDDEQPETSTARRSINFPWSVGTCRPMTRRPDPVVPDRPRPNPRSGFPCSVLGARPGGACRRRWRKGMSTGFILLLWRI